MIMFRMRSVLGAAMLLLFLVVPAAAQQSIEFSSTLNPLGSGARAVGMGGAFIGVADDATAASWNPAGLIQLEKPELSFVYAAGRREQDYVSTLHPEINGSNAMSSDGINYLSAAAPLVLCGRENKDCRNIVVSINYQRLYEMDKKVNMTFDHHLSAPSSYAETIQFKQEGYLYALSPAAAVQVTPALSLGVTLNVWKDFAGTNGWEQTYHSSGSGNIGGPFSDTFDQKTTVDFEGTNVNLGVLWDATPWLAVGGVYKTSFDARLTQHTQSTYADNSGFTLTSDTKDILTMVMPASYGIGFKVHPSDSIVVALDAYRTEWSKFLLRDAGGQETNPLTGKPLDEGKPRSTTQVRLGGEYLFIGKGSVVALRGGVFSDPQPDMGKVDRYYGAALGTGYSTKKFSVDMAYQYRVGKNVRGDIITIDDNVMDVTEQSVMASIIYYF